MPTEIFIVRITPPAREGDNPFPFIRISRLRRTRRTPRPRLRLAESGYQEESMDFNYDYPTRRNSLLVARQIQNS